MPPVGARPLSRTVDAALPAGANDALQAEAAVEWLLDRDDAHLDDALVGGGDGDANGIRPPAWS